MEAHKTHGPYERWIKRLADIICSLLMIILFCWLYAVLAILIKVRLGSPIIFTQNRPGIIDKSTGKEHIFKLYKFRTMTDERNDNGELLPGSKRLTKFGKTLRTTSLDELPEILNILKGDMSFIGPRPLAVEYLPYYRDEERVRHSVRPGLTGLAQINGRNDLSWEEKFRYDVQYSNSISFHMDCMVILMTIKTVFSREGIGQGDQAPESFHIVRQKQMDDKYEG